MKKFILTAALLTSSFISLQAAQNEKTIGALGFWNKIGVQYTSRFVINVTGITEVNEDQTTLTTKVKDIHDLIIENEDQCELVKIKFTKKYVTQSKIVGFINNMFNINSGTGAVCTITVQNLQAPESENLFAQHAPVTFESTDYPNFTTFHEATLTQIKKYLDEYKHENLD